jgi:phosphate transport system substrate-binding protein
MKLSKKIGIVALVSGLLVGTAPAAFAYDLSGQGASFPALLIEACKVPFAKTSGHSLTYNPNGSGAGKTASDNQTGNVWFSDSPNLNSTARPSLIHIPAVAAPIAVLHNLPAKTQLYLSPTTAAKIFAGEITRWNDPLIAKDNNRAVKDVIYRKDKNGDVVKDKAGKPIVLRTTTKNVTYTLPNQPIKVIFRADKSGTSNNFTKWLNGVAPSVWTKPANDLFSTAFPTNINAPANIGRIVGANYSAGVSQMAAASKYSITYAEASYGEKYGLKTAAIGNASGNFILPTATATGAFLASSKIGATGFFTFDYQTMEPGAYTLGIISYMLGDSNYKDKAALPAIKAWANFVISRECTDLGASDAFIPIEGQLRKIAEAAIAKLG